MGHGHAGAGDVIRVMQIQRSSKTRYSDTRWHEDSVRNRWFSMIYEAVCNMRNEWLSAYAMAGVTQPCFDVPGHSRN